MTTKPTPGPWNIRYAADRADAFIERGDRSNITDKDASLVAQCFMHSTEDEANARLIAAAPELLAALRELEARYPNNVGMVAARAAIKKAEGHE